MNKEKLFLSNKNMPEEIIGKKVFPGFYIYNPHIPFYLYTPITIGMILLSIFYVQIVWWKILIGFLSAVAFWTIFEYMMHRFFFHWEPKGKFWKKLLYTIHHGHHDYPNDSRLMLVGPIVSLPAFLIIWALVYLVVGHHAHSFMAGMASCYMFYDWLHYASHNYNFKNSFFQKLKIHHMRHHYENNDKNFAFTTLIWDIIMKTRIKNKK